MRFAPLLVLLACGLADALEEPDSLPPSRWDVSVRVDASTLGMSLYQSSRENEIRLEANNPPSVGLEVRYEGMGGAASFASGKLKEDVDVETDCWDLQWFWYFPRVGFDLYLQSYEGYAVEGDSLTEIVAHRDMRLSTQTFAVYTKLKGNVGVDAMNQPVARKEWISWLLYAVADVSHRRMESSTPVIPASLRERYGSIATLDRIDVLAPSLSTGLFVPVHFGPLYANAGMSVGLGVPFDLGDSDIRTTQSVKINLKIAIGWEGNGGGVGLVAVNDSNAEELEDAATAQFHSVTARFFAHRRF